MALNRRPAIDSRWQESIRKVSRGFENATIEIIEPGLSVPYDPEDGSGGDQETNTRIWPNANWNESEPRANAWVEGLGSPSAYQGQPQQTDITRLRIHIDLVNFGTTEDIRVGHTVHVIDGGRDHTLETRVITVREVIVGSQAAQRTLECSVDQKAIRGQASGIS